MPQPTCTAARPLPSPVLTQLARHVAEVHRGTSRAALLRVRPSPSGVKVGQLALPEGVHPSVALVGHVVPPAWAASGIVAPARARPTDGSDPAPTPTTVVVLVGRDGHVASHATDVDGVGDDDAPVGRLPDLLRRSLGLPTPAAGVPVAEWWQACWLDSLVAAAAAEPGGDVVPALPLTGTMPVALVQALVDEPDLCTEAGWARVRQLAAAPEPPADPGPAAVRATVAPFVTPAEAAWFDDGSFARWVLGSLPSVDELLGLAAALVPRATLETLHEVSGRPPPGSDPPVGEPAPRPGRGGADAPR
jgi:hypothetical protein